MGGRLSPVIIIVLLLVVIALGLLGYQFISGSSSNQNGVGPEEVVEAIKPTINLDKNTNNDGSVTITAIATTEDEAGIDYITLPNKEIVKSDRAEYKVSENGKYTFSTTGINGESSEELIIEVNEIASYSDENPYIPDGFESIGGDVDSGFVISDEYGNQYVWIPVPSGKLKRNTELDIKYEEKNEAAAALVNSVAKYYGFYIGRFEASEYELNGKKIAASMSGKIPWTDINCQEATDYSKNSGLDFGYSDDIYTSLINSYAWDTAVTWIEEQYPSYSSSVGYGNYEGTILPTGTTEKDRLRGICDLSGNVREWTTEKFLGGDASRNSDSEENVINRVIRGGAANISRTPNSHIGYKENTSDLYWGFRIILYKQ